MKNLVSIADCSKQQLLEILSLATKFEENPNRKILDGKIVATLFFEP